MKRDAVTSNIVWNARRPMSSAPGSPWQYLIYLYVALPLVAALGKGLAEADSRVSWLWPAVGVPCLFVVVSMALSEAVAWLLGLRSGWAVVEDALVIQGPFRRRFLRSSQIKSLGVSEDKRERLWTSVEFTNGDPKVILAGVPVADIPVVSAELGIKYSGWSHTQTYARAERRRVRLASDSGFGLVKRLLRVQPRSEDELLVHRARMESGLMLSAEQVGLVRALKLANAIPQAEEFGRSCDDSVLQDLVREVLGQGCLFESGPILGQAFVYLNLVSDPGEFDVGWLMQAMGEDGSAVFLLTAGAALELAGSRLSGFGVAESGPVDGDGLAFGAEPTLVLAWLCLAVARLARAGRIPPLDELPGWPAV